MANKLEGKVALATARTTMLLMSVISDSNKLQAVRSTD